MVDIADIFTTLQEELHLNLKMLFFLQGFKTTDFWWGPQIEAKKKKNLWGSKTLIRFTIRDFWHLSVVLRKTNSSPAFHDQDLPRDQHGKWGSCFCTISGISGPDILGPRLHRTYVDGVENNLKFVFWEEAAVRVLKIKAITLFPCVDPAKKGRHISHRALARDTQLSCKSGDLLGTKGETSRFPWED